MKATKKELARHSKSFDRELGHSEGNCWCDCKTRNYRLYLGLKLYGPVDVKSEVDSVSKEKYNRGRAEAAGEAPEAGEPQPLTRDNRGERDGGRCVSERKP